MHNDGMLQIERIDLNVKCNRKENGRLNLNYDVMEESECMME